MKACVCLSLAIREAAVRDGAQGSERPEAEGGVPPRQGGPAVSLHVPDRAGQPRGRVGLCGDDRRRLRGLGEWASVPAGCSMPFRSRLVFHRTLVSEERATLPSCTASQLPHQDARL